MKILFIGSVQGNTGPSNVNKELKKNFTGEFMTIESKGKLSRATDLVVKILLSDVVVVSGLTGDGIRGIKLAKLFRKKTVYIMHGCAEYECKLNGDEAESAIAQEQYIINHVDLILAVSKKFSLWVKQNFPANADRVSYLYNGVVKPTDRKVNEKVKGTIVAVGGDRVTKNNKIVSEVVNGLDGKARITICGKIHGNSDLLPHGEYVRYTDLIPQDEFYNILENSEVFIINSIFEPFSLSVIDALNCGCSVLISSHVGIGDLLELDEMDIIQDPMNADEIREKIINVLKYPNCERIASKIAYESLSYKKEVELLVDYCRRLCNRA